MGRKYCHVRFFCPKGVAGDVVESWRKHQGSSRVLLVVKGEGFPGGLISRSGLSNVVNTLLMWAAEEELLEGYPNVWT